VDAITQAGDISAFYDPRCRTGAIDFVFACFVPPGIPGFEAKE
jgi:hypothetical protein